MATVGAFSRHNHLDELDSPLVTNEGMLSPSARKQRVLGNLDITATPAEINAAADVSSRLVSIADAATYTVLAADSGKTHVIPDLTADIVITLPTAAAGLEYRFMYGGVAADAQDWKISAGVAYKGGGLHIDSDAGAGADEAVPVFPNGSSNDNLIVLTPQGGTWVYLICDGTNWFVNACVVSATAAALAFADT